MIGLNYYENSSIEINNCYNTGNITGKAVYKGNIIGNAISLDNIINNSYIAKNENIDILGAGSYTGNVEVKTIEEIKT